MIEFCQLPFHFDAARLRGELERVPQDVWREHYVARDYRGEWTVVALRSVGGRAGLIQSSILPPDQFRETEVLLASPYFQEVLATLSCPMFAVRLMRLGAGSEIREHADSSTGYEDGNVRLHIPVQTHSLVEFYLNGQRVAMQEGECWYMNFNLPHRVVNASPIDRVHLVIDCLVDPWLEDVFASLGFGEAEKQGPARGLAPVTAEGARTAVELLREMDTLTSHRIADELEHGDLLSSGHLSSATKERR